MSHSVKQHLRYRLDSPSSPAKIFELKYSRCHCHRWSPVCFLFCWSTLETFYCVWQIVDLPFEVFMNSWWCARVTGTFSDAALLYILYHISKAQPNTFLYGHPSGGACPKFGSCFSWYCNNTTCKTNCFLNGILWTLWMGILHSWLV